MELNGSERMRLELEATIRYVLVDSGQGVDG